MTRYAASSLLSNHAAACKKSSIMLQVRPYIFSIVIFFVAVAEENVVSTLTPESQTGGSASGLYVWVVVATCILVLLIAVFTTIIVSRMRRAARQRALSVGSDDSVESVYSATSIYRVDSAELKKLREER